MPRLSRDPIAAAAVVRRLLNALALCLVAGLASVAEEVRLAATRDNSIVLHPAEMAMNAGSAKHIRIKGNQHIVVMGFDVSALRGRPVRSATLICGKGDAEIVGVTISTVQAEWDEMRSSALTAGIGAEKGWGVPGTLFPAVCGGNSGSLVCHVRARAKDGLYYWPIHADLVNAMSVGASFGLAIHEHDADYARNPTILSRESGTPPRLVVELAPPEPPPVAPTDLHISGNGDPESIRLHLTAPSNGLAYEVNVNGAALPRWNTPFVQPGKQQAIPIRDIPITPGSPLDISVVTVGRDGARSVPAMTKASAPFIRPPMLPQISPPQFHRDAKDGRAILPTEDRLDGRGQPIGFITPGWLECNETTGPENVISLRAARGEVLGFQVCIQGELTGRPECKIEGARTELHRALLVDSEMGPIPDPLVPIDDPRSRPETTSAVVVDVYIPFELQARELHGSLHLSRGTAIPIQIKIRDFALPRRATFLCEMNTYGMPDRVADFYAMQQVAYDHRVHCNVLHYGHGSAAPGARNSNLDMVLPDGRRMDQRRYNAIAPGSPHGYWDDFVTAFDPYLTGQCFRDGHRGAIPAPGFYLTFHESWPLNVRAYFNGDPDAYAAFKDDPIYAQTFQNILRDFIGVANARRWHETGFQIYLNNKGSLNDAKKCPWVLDEPAAYWDYRALAYYGDLVREARAGESPPRIDYRIDISRPEFDRGLLAGKSDLWVVNGRAFDQYHRLVMDRAEATGEKIWVYGAAAPAHQSSRSIMAWAIAAYRNGATGLVPWQTVNRDGSAFQKADPLGIFIFDRAPDGGLSVRPTLRLKAFRRAQQDIEYLGLARGRAGWTPGQLRAFIDHYLPIHGVTPARDDDEAAAPSFDTLDPRAFHALREAAATIIESHPPPTSPTP